MIFLFFLHSLFISGWAKYFKHRQILAKCSVNMKAVKTEYERC